MMVMSLLERSATHPRWRMLFTLTSRLCGLPTSRHNRLSSVRPRRIRSVLLNRSGGASGAVGLRHFSVVARQEVSTRFSGEWAFKASVLGCDDALSGHLFLDPEGRAAYLADGVKLVGRGTGHWFLAEDGRGAALELDVFQYAAASATIPDKPHRFRGVWSCGSLSTLAGEWYFCPDGHEAPRLVGRFQAAETSLQEVEPSGDTHVVPGPTRDALMSAMDEKRTHRKPDASEQLSAWNVGYIPSAQYIPNWIEAWQEEAFLRLTDENVHAWEQMGTRSSQEWGAGGKLPCSRGLLRAPLPAWQQQLADVLHDQGVYDRALFPMNSVRINGYTPGQGIHPHCDGPVYYPKVAILSLGSPCVFSFYPKTGNENTMQWDRVNDVPSGHRDGDTPQLSLLIEPRSLLLFDKDLFWHHRHGIAAALEDELTPDVVNLDSTGYCAGMKLARRRRVSLTMRHLLARCSWPACACVS